MKTGTGGPTISTLKINSKDNSTYKKLSQLTTSKGVKKHHLAMVCGPKLTREMLANHCSKVEYLIISNLPRHVSMAQAYLSSLQDNAEFSYAAIKILELAPELFEALDIYQTDHPIVICRYSEFIPFNCSTIETGKSIILPLQDPDNLGAAVRTALGFGVEKIILTQESAHPFHAKSVRTSSGAVFGVEFYHLQRWEDLKTIQSTDHEFFALDAGGKNIETHSFKNNWTLIVGVEGPGIQNIVFKDYQPLSISMDPRIESFNAAIATAIALYAASS
jgi:RNA methyltransferase, TrmH family